MPPSTAHTAPTTSTEAGAETCDYASQAAYENGALMCTTAAVYWGLSCVCEIVQPMCSRPQMQLLMRTAAATHSTIVRQRPADLEAMLQQHEVLRCIEQPCALRAEELYGYCGDKVPEMAAFVHESDVFALLGRNESLVLTGYLNIWVHISVHIHMHIHIYKYILFCVYMYMIQIYESMYM